MARRLEREPLDQFLDRWLSNPLFSGLSPQAAARAERLSNRPDGLAASLRHSGTGTQESLWDRLPELAMPVLLITGGEDTKFSALAERMATAASGTAVTVASIEGTHAVHLEHPAVVADAVTQWLTTVWSTA